MRIILFVFLLIPVISLAQNTPRFENDTLHTTCGYKIYKGMNLQFGKSTGQGEFMYVNIKNNVPHPRLQNHSILINDLKEFGISALGNGYITIKGKLMINGNEREEIIVHMAFDNAIENIPGIPSEVIVPDEFKGKRKTDGAKEIQRLDKLYTYGTISSEQLEFHKTKLMNQ